jgi:hypothetical protein
MLPMDATPEQQNQLANELAIKNLANDPTYKKMYKDFFGFEFNMPTGAVTKPSPGQYDSAYGLTPRKG